jgi:hypothetical protein
MPSATAQLMSHRAPSALRTLLLNKALKPSQLLIRDRRMNEVRIVVFDGGETTLTEAAVNEVLERVGAH